MTAQMHERLVLDGVETSMAFCPPLPEGHPRLVAVDPGTAPDPQASSILYSTACWRQYQGTWEIRDARFYLTDIRGRFCLEGTGPLLADWFSGVLRVPRGRMLRYVHMGFGSVFEEELHIRINKGIVVSTRVVDNRGHENDDPNLGLKNLPGGENRFPGEDQL